MHSVPIHRRQRGAIIITTCLLLLFLLGFMAFALDFGRLFIVKTELQTAMDACALSAVAELDGLSNAVSRGQSAGVTAANLNRVNLQSPDWDGKGQVTTAEVTFLDKDYVTTSSDAAAVYAQCQHTQPAVRLWLMRAMAAFSGNTTTFKATQDVGARAVAKRGSAQATCPIPVALKAAAGSTRANLYGFKVGQWVTIFNKTHNSGEFGWYNLDGSTSANETKDELTSEKCNTRVGQALGTPGAQTAVDVPWNYRFGIYKNNADPNVNRPDYSGYSYRAANATDKGNWENNTALTLADGTKTTFCCAWDGMPGGAAKAGAQNFITKRASFASFDDQGTDLKDGSLIVYSDKNMMNGFKALATPGANGQHHQYGADRRIASVPVLDDANKVKDYLCIFMLHPMTGPNDDNKIEIRGLASDPSSPCTISGLPGGVAGPLVPVLVR